MDQFMIDVSYNGTNNEIAVVTPHGYIDATTYLDLEKEILNQLSEEHYKIAVNLPFCEYVNSAGWGVFIREIKDIRQHHGDLVLVDMSPDVYLVYETMEFSKILKSFPSLSESVSYFCRDSD